jgi:steroid delta-isomerase-like uncharacterized protein
MTNERLAAFIDHHTAAWNRRDADTLSLDHAENGVVISPMFARVDGRPAIRDTYASLFGVFPDWQIRFDAPIADRDRVAVAFSVTATHRGDFMGLEGTGRRCSFDGVSLFDLSPDLLIAAERRFYDFTGMLAQLGVLRVRPAR